MDETAVVFKGHQHWLTGMVHQANCADETPVKQGVIIIVGGPQTRVGSHRQFVLLARFLAAHGIAVFRFDYAGIGDSDGKPSDFLTAYQDIPAAIEQFQAQCPMLKHIALWGLCDGASAILLYLSQHQPAVINQIFIANPWVEQPDTKAKTLLKYYYLERLLSKEFWQKLSSGRFHFSAAVTGLFTTVRGIYLPKNSCESSASLLASNKFNQDNFVHYMGQGLTKFNGQVHFIASGQDLVVKEFIQLLSDDSQWAQLWSQKMTSELKLAAANHTFSCAQWRSEVENYTVNTIVQG